MYFDRFDICAAYYLYGSLYHGGQCTKEYAYTSRALECGFEPGPIFSYDSLSDNAKMIYKSLKRRHKSKR